MFDSLNLRRYSPRVLSLASSRGRHPWGEGLNCIWILLDTFEVCKEQETKLSLPGQHVAEAELLSIVWEVFCEFSTLKHKNCSFRVNHTLLLKAILLHCGIEAEKHGDIYNILSEARVSPLSCWSKHCMTHRKHIFKNVNNLHIGRIQCKIFHNRKINLNTTY